LLLEKKYKICGKIILVADKKEKKNVKKSAVFVRNLKTE